MVLGGDGLHRNRNTNTGLVYFKVKKCVRTFREGLKEQSETVTY